jgi:ABC-type spermidine/putrescine transport system permease subunit II
VTTGAAQTGGDAPSAARAVDTPGPARAGVGPVVEPRCSPRRVDLGAWAVNAVVSSTLAFLLLPLIVVTLASFTGGSRVSFPPKPPLGVQWYVQFFTGDRWVIALQSSLIIAGLVVLVSGPVGTLAAVGWTRRTFRGKELVYQLLFVPFLVPGLVLAIGLLMSLRPLRLEALYGSWWSVVIGHSLWATPVVFVVMVAVLQNIDADVVAAAKNLGAGPVRVFVEITLPLARAGVVASFVMAFVISFHEFIMALFLLAKRPVRTLPVEVWNSLRYELSPVIAAIDAFMITSVVVALLVVAKLVGIERIAPR